MALVLISAAVTPGFINVPFPTMRIMEAETRLAQLNATAAILAVRAAELQARIKAPVQAPPPPPAYLLFDDFDTLDTSIWQQRGSPPVVEGVLQMDANKNIKTIADTFKAPITVESKMMAKGENCIQMQVLKPDSWTRHDGYNYCGLCCGNKEQIYPGGTSSGCQNFESSSVGIAVNKWGWSRITVDETGKARLYVKGTGDWTHVKTVMADFGTGEGKIGFTDHCQGVHLDYMWVKEGVIAPDGLGGES